MVMISPFSSVVAEVAVSTDRMVCEDHTLLVSDVPRAAPLVTGEPASEPVVWLGVRVFSNTSKPPVRPIMPSRYCWRIFAWSWNRPLTASENSTRESGLRIAVRLASGASDLVRLLEPLAKYLYVISALVVALV